MSQFEANYDAVPAEQKTSGLAIAALVCSLILCCPITTVLGVILGLIAAVTAKKGKGLAIAAIIIGLIATVLWVVGINWGYKTFAVPVMRGPTDALVAGYAGNTAGFNAAMAPGYGATDAEITAFIDEMRSRYGEFQSVEMSQNNQTQSGQQPEAPFEYYLHFDSGETVTCETLMIFADPSGGGLVMKPGRITIFDPDLGDLEIPTPSTGSSSPGPDEDVDADGNG